MLIVFLNEDKGEDLYLQMTEYPHELSHVLIDKTEKYKGVDMIIRKSMSKKIQGQGSDQCLDVNSQEYANLISQKTVEYLGANVSCTTPYTAKILESKKLPKCSDHQSAMRNQSEVTKKFHKAILNTHKICSISSYQSNEDYYNRNIETDLSASPPRLYVVYGSTIVEEKIEQYMYDPGTLLTSIGGNMGLFLGFSCLSCFLWLINFCKESVCKSF